ncbi:MAG: AAA-associated domain-containing protein [Sulfolobales archaeon]
MSQHRKAQIPICVTIDQVIGLVEILYSLGGVADTSKISEIVDVDAGLLPNVIDVAEALGLVRLSKGDLEITSLGRDVARANSRSLKKMLRELALKLEPISTIYREASVKGYISREELEKILEAFYGPEGGRAFECIISWGIYLGLFRWSPDTQILTHMRRHPS